MHRLALSFAMWRNPRVCGVFDGSVAIEGRGSHADGVSVGGHVLASIPVAEFDISEMSIASLSLSAAKGDQR